MCVLCCYGSHFLTCTTKARPVVEEKSSRSSQKSDWSPTGHLCIGLKMEASRCFPAVLTVQEDLSGRLTETERSPVQTLKRFSHNQTIARISMVIIVIVRRMVRWKRGSRAVKQRERECESGQDVWSGSRCHSICFIGKDTSGLRNYLFIKDKSYSCSGHISQNNKKCQCWTSKNNNQGCIHSGS